jgi:membrane protease YdiL (CAAX protease family)
MNKIVISYAICACALLFLFEQVIDVTYGIKTGLKIFLFAIVPLGFVLKTRAFTLFKNADKKGLLLGFLFGITSFLVVIVAFILFQDIIDTDSIVQNLEEKNITASTFLLIGLYITFGNSFLEEFFFRGFIFFNLVKKNKVFAYVFSSLLFAIYHMAIFTGWFNLPLTVLALLGLFIIGLVFNWLNQKSNSMLNSWLVHIFADIAIILIGCHLFGII